MRTVRLFEQDYQAFGPFKLRRFSLAKTYQAFRIWRHQSVRLSATRVNIAFKSTLVEYCTLMYSAAWSPAGRLAQCQRLKGHVPGVVVEDVEMHGQALDQEQLLMGEEKGSLLRGRLPMRQQTANPPIISNHLPIRISTTTSHGRTRLPSPRRSRVMQAECRTRRARLGATQPWKIAGPTSSA